MAAEDLSTLLRVPCKVAVNPTAFTGAFPYGGTQLGEVADVMARPRRKHKAITAEEYGPEVVEAIDLGEAWQVAFILRGWDDDALSNVFSATATGASSGRKIIDYPGSFVSGATKGSGAVGLLVAADDPLRMPSVYMPKAMLFVDEDNEIQMTLAKEGMILVVAYAIRRASDVRAFQWGRLEDLTA